MYSERAHFKNQFFPQISGKSTIFHIHNIEQSFHYKNLLLKLPFRQLNSKNFQKNCGEPTGMILSVRSQSRKRKLNAKQCMDVGHVGSKCQFRVDNLVSLRWYYVDDILNLYTTLHMVSPHATTRFFGLVFFAIFCFYLKFLNENVMKTFLVCEKN